MNNTEVNTARLRENKWQHAWVKHLFLVSASRQLLQVGEPAQRTGFSAPWRFLKKLTLVTEF
jgi:hypothetical protein